MFPPEEPRTTLRLFAKLDVPRRDLDGPWRYAFDEASEGLGRGYADPGFDDSAWKVVRLPHLEHSTGGQDTVWHRHCFDLAERLPAAERLESGARVLLRFGGAFYRTRVWLNGVELGGHEGYFQPFGFDVTGITRPGRNVLAVRCRFPVEAGSFKRKTAVAGVFADWDCKPYPSALYPNLPPPNEWSVPVGLWRPVSVLKTGPVLVESFNVLPEVIAPHWPAGRVPGMAGAAKLRVALDLVNLTEARQDITAAVRITPHNFQEGPKIVAEESVSLSGHERRRVELTLHLPQARLWLPWTHGEPCLYRAAVRVASPDRGGEADCEAERVFGVREVRAEIDSERWEWRLNGRRIFPRGSNYTSDFYLDRVSPEGLGRDVELARGANLDMLRVHAHIAPEDFYRLCDEQGIMVMCDFPLIWTYAYDLPRQDEAEFRASVGRQASDMIDLLGSHPSIVLWSMHNEPPWTEDGSFLGSDVHRSGTNREMDEALAERVRALDPTRPVIPASGEMDAHLYHGWYTGHWTDNRDLAPTFPTEFGVQALPDLDSPFWATVNANWPVDADDPSWAHAGYQPIFWNSPGVGAPSDYDSLAGYVAASQDYQAFYIRYTIDQWRRRKFRPVGGYLHFLFTDGWPAISWSVLDYFRLPKVGYHALAEASRPVRLCLDLMDGFRVEHGYRLVYPERGELRLRLFLVNDDYREAGRVKIRWWIERRAGGLGGAAERLIGRITSRWLDAELPGADEPARLVGEVRASLARPGEYIFRTTVTQGPRLLDANRLDFRVGAERARPRGKSVRRVPSLLINKVYQVGSLRHAAEGFTFILHNPAMPVVLQRLLEARVDGQGVNMAWVELVLGGQSRRATAIASHSPLEFPSGERLVVFVRGMELAPGAHEIELTAEFLGLGEISAHIKDRLV